MTKGPSMPFSLNIFLRFRFWRKSLLYRTLRVVLILSLSNRHLKVFLTTSESISFRYPKTRFLIGDKTFFKRGRSSSRGLDRGFLI